MRVESISVRRLLASCLLPAIATWVTGAQADAFADFGVQIPQSSVPAPDFSLPRLGGGSLTLSALRGNVVILHFWATWCRPCRQEMPQIEVLWRKHEKQMAVLGINVDRGNPSGVARFMQALHIGFPCALDSAGSVRNRYRIRGLPASYLIDRDGHIIGRIIGKRDWSSPAARKLIDDLVGREKAATDGRAR